MWFRHVFISVCLLFSVNVSATLIVNGSFEDNDVKNNGWRWFKAEDVNGWSGANIEIWDSLQRFESFDGEQHAELNSHAWRGQYSIYQSFQSLASNKYEVSFAYASRRSRGESFEFEVLDANGSTLFSRIFDDHLQKQWQTFSTSFMATTTSTTLRFTSLNSGTYGNFLDAIVVESENWTGAKTSNAVSAPASLGFLISMTCLLVLRQRLPRK